MARDVTELKEKEERLIRAEEALRHSHDELASRYKAVVRASGQLIYEWDPVSGERAHGRLSTAHEKPFSAEKTRVPLPQPLLDKLLEDRHLPK